VKANVWQTFGARDFGQLDKVSFNNTGFPTLSENNMEKTVLQPYVQYTMSVKHKELVNHKTKLKDA
jgi:hypothetical protein